MAGPDDPGVGAGEARSLRYHTASGRWVIAATVLGSGMAAVDATVIGIALPTIGRDFHALLGTLQWVVTGYTPDPQLAAAPRRSVWATVSVAGGSS